jgi:hypothetical protein
MSQNAVELIIVMVAIIETRRPFSHVAHYLTAYLP